MLRVCSCPVQRVPSWNRGVSSVAKRRGNGANALSTPVEKVIKFSFQGESFHFTHRYAPPPQPSMPTTNWANPATQIPNRKPTKTMYRVPLGSGASIAELKSRVMTAKEASRANTLLNKRRGAALVVEHETPGMCIVPPIAVPKGVQLGVGPGQKNVMQSLLDSQVRGGDYSMYMPGAALRKLPSNVKQAKNPESLAQIQADQALAENATIHPIGRRFLIERLSAQLHTPS